VVYRVTWFLALVLTLVYLVDDIIENHFE